MPESEVIQGFAENNGVQLYYETRGHGEPLICISGGGGDAGFFTKLANYLKDSFTVITYDRRGYSRSTRPQANNFNIQDHVADVKAILHANGYERAYILGNSAGAIIALETAVRMPEIIKKVIIHEPPVVNVLQNNKKYLHFMTKTYNIGLRYGSNLASNWFNFSLSLPFSVFKHIPKDFQERMTQYKNNEQLIFVELLGLSRYVPDYKKIIDHNVDIYLASGNRTMKKKKYYGVTSPIIAKNLKCPFIIFPGHHLSFLDQTEIWGNKLKQILLD
ncbi:alpha/beta hydrolase [Oceanobacillus sp. FSL W8-0428]|uniref:alpha/beta hydrolase n=1 Tax=Oceanobacillus TaxID=182709 RepID=UPI0030D95D52